ncbi:uncharacterized protein LOC112053692 [Bicyclus anynana]|uniref:Uncharacterized protein LOC112053692 n=1 Tax=Bicyclus anynana TaxID=110368 RepID=A0ABM3M329_BICAN|nr:uncharacterized protein LOC112053692 [Bicyclus anynana]
MVDTKQTQTMRCCVPLCKNTSDNASTSERTGITFRRLPNEEILRTAWLRALGTEDHHLPDPAVVCSQHFSDDNFSNTKTCVRQIHSNCNASTVQVDKSAVEAVVIKKEDCSVYEDDCVSNEKYPNISIKIELEPLDEAVSEAIHRKTVTSSTTVAGYVIKAESCKSESITFGCTVCYQDFVQENAYNEHMSMHLKVSCRYCHAN